jgi:hypothetical protein
MEIEGRRMLELKKKLRVQYKMGEQAITRSLIIHLSGIDSLQQARNRFLKSAIQTPEGQNGIGPRSEEYSMIPKI